MQLAAAAVVIAAAVIAAAIAAQHIPTAAVAQQKDQNDDPANITATETVVVTHKDYLRKFLHGCLPLIPRYSDSGIWCKGRRYLWINGMRAILKPKECDCVKKRMAFALVFVCLLSLVGCGKSEESEYPYYFIGEIVGEHEWGSIVKVVDYGNHDFNSSEVILHQVKLGMRYAVGDYIRVEFDGLFLETDPPQIKSAISIGKTDTPEQY